MSDQKTFLNAFSGEWNTEAIINKMKDQTVNSFYLCNLSDIIRKFDDWLKNMPRVKPFYAVSVPKILFLRFRLQ